ncbi:MAG: hypothetical protein JXB40_04405, partial [Candidatus Omnitrophica bacterium]|nr:hypothetical protein [Candidatus Omnitrophota bacterium]
MNTLKKITSLLVIMCFLANQIAFGYDAASFKLAVPTKLSNTGFRNAADIEVGIRENLKGIQNLSLQSLKNLGEKEILRYSIFSPKVNGSIKFNEAEEVEIKGDSEYALRKNYFVRATVDGVDYACMISAGKPQQYEVSVINYKEYVGAKERGTINVLHDLVDAETRAILNRYVEHEVSTDNSAAIDPWIASKMAAGKYAINSFYSGKPEYAIYNHSARKTYSNKEYNVIMRRISDFLKVAGVKDRNEIIAEMLRKPLIILPSDGDNDLPTITVDGKTVRVRAHSSHYATYVFLPKAMYDHVTRDFAWGVSEREIIEASIVHEIGASCGLNATLIYNKVITNALDDVYDRYVSSGRPSTLKLSAAMKEKIENLVPVNLTALELRNDYAAGKVPEKMGIFKRLMMLLIAAIGINVAMLPTKAKAQVNVPPQPTLSANDINLPSGYLMVVKPDGVQATVTDGAYVSYREYPAALSIGTGTNKVYQDGRLMSEEINGVRHVYVGFSGAGTNSIQAVVDSASAGSLVLVKSGTYTEDIVLKDGVRLLGGFNDVARDLSGTPSIVKGTIIAENITSPSEIDGFFIKVGQGTKGIDIRNCNDNLVVLNNRIENDDTLDITSSYNVGISATNSQAVIYNNSITNCYWFGIYAKGSSLIVENNKIHGTYRDGVQELSGNSTYRNNFFWDNGLMTNTGSHMLLFDSAPLLDKNTFYGSDMGLFLWDSDPEMTDNIFERVANSKFNSPGSSNAVTESGTIDDPTGSMPLGINPEAGNFKATGAPGVGYNPDSVREDYNKISVNGLTLEYMTSTGSASWAGGGYTYDDPATMGVVETANLSSLPTFIVGVQGNPAKVKMELADATTSSSVYLDQVSQYKRGVWSASSSLFTTVNKGAIRAVSFIVEGENKTGSVGIQTMPGGVPGYNIPPTAGLTTNDINLVTTDMYINPAPAGASSTVTNIGGGVTKLSFTTGTNTAAWAAGGFTWDNLGNSIGESINLSGLAN